MTNNSTYQNTNLNQKVTFSGLSSKLVSVEKVQYGKVIMYRAECSKCNEILFENNFDFKCDSCGFEFKGTIQKLRIEVNTVNRKKPSKKVKEKILKDQNHKCYWCDHDFHTPYFRYNSIRKLLPNWDHLIPYAYVQANADDNFVASCSICNGFKSSKMFNSDEACKVYLKERWNTYLKKGRITLL